MAKKFETNDNSVMKENTQWLAVYVRDPKQPDNIKQFIIKDAQEWDSNSDLIEYLKTYDTGLTPKVRLYCHGTQGEDYLAAANFAKDHIHKGDSSYDILIVPHNKYSVPIANLATQQQIEENGKAYAKPINDILKTIKNKGEKFSGKTLTVEGYSMGNHLMMEICKHIDNEAFKSEDRVHFVFRNIPKCRVGPVNFINRPPYVADQFTNILSDKNSPFHHEKLHGSFLDRININIESKESTYHAASGVIDFLEELYKKYEEKKIKLSKNNKIFIHFDETSIDRLKQGCEYQDFCERTINALEKCDSTGKTGELLTYANQRKEKGIFKTPHFDTSAPKIIITAGGIAGASGMTVGILGIKDIIKLKKIQCRVILILSLTILVATAIYGALYAQHIFKQKNNSPNDLLNIDNTRPTQNNQTSKQ